MTPHESDADLKGYRPTVGVAYATNAAQKIHKLTVYCCKLTVHMMCSIAEPCMATSGPLQAPMRLAAPPHLRFTYRCASTLMFGAQNLEGERHKNWRAVRPAPRTSKVVWQTRAEWPCRHIPVRPCP